MTDFREVIVEAIPCNIVYGRPQAADSIITALASAGYVIISTTDAGKAKQRELTNAVISFEDFINEPPQYEDQRMVRDYRHELYRKWKPLCRMIRATLGGHSNG